MTSRERVNSPDELRGGDRVELLDRDDPGKVAVIDVLWRAGGFWCGMVVEVSARTKDIDGEPMEVGETGWIGHEAYARGEVFIRRRSVEGLAVSRGRQVQR